MPRPDEPQTLWDWLDELKASRAQGDPWYQTASKAIIGTRDYNRVAAGEVMPWAEHLLPFVLSGGGRAAAGRPVVPTLTPRELELPPETARLLSAVRSYEPPAPQVNTDAVRPYEPPVAPQRYDPKDVFNWENLPYAPRPRNFYAPKDYLDYLHFKEGGDYVFPYQIQEGIPFQPRLEEPPGTVHMSQGGVLGGGDPLSLDDYWFDTVPVELFPRMTIRPADHVGFPPEPFPFFDYTQSYPTPTPTPTPTPAMTPDEEAEAAQNVVIPPSAPPEHFDSADYIGGANYYYTAPPAPAPVPAPVTNNYYGALDDYRRNELDRLQRQRFGENLSRSIGASLPPATSSNPDEQVAMLRQYAEMQRIQELYDQRERELKLRQAKYDAETRFGTPR